jgi:uncharacterized protein
MEHKIKVDKIAKSFFSQSLGLMFQRKKDLLMVFEKEQIVPLHNWFVFYPIDLVFLDKNKKVVEIKHNFKPFTFYTSKKKAKYLLELSKSKISPKLNDFVVIDK